MSATADDVSQQLQGGNQPPQGAPMSNPTEKAGDRMVSDASIQTAMMLLQSALPAYGMGSREGKAVLDVLKKLAMVFGQPAPQSQLVPAQIQALARQAAQGGANAQQGVQ